MTWFMKTQSLLQCYTESAGKWQTDFSEENAASSIRGHGPSVTVYQQCRKDSDLH